MVAEGSTPDGTPRRCHRPGAGESRLSGRRSRLRVLARLGVLGGFSLAASVVASAGAGSPAGATTARADATAKYSACVGPATVDAGFTDVAADSVHNAAINCIAYYGITRGTSPDKFSPNRTIPRWQLAVMLQRAATPAGVILPAAQNAGFTDISGLASPFQNAINQMTAMGVMRGISATAFDPGRSVSRAVIVEALAQFLTHARIGPGGKVLSVGPDRRFLIRESAASNEMIPIDESFRDIGSVPYATNQAIRAMAEMGVAQGRGDGTFSPVGSVTRAQAAAFITRALAHTDARPAGLTVQAEKSSVEADADFELAVSLRSPGFVPVPGIPVDVFSHAVDDAWLAFNADGTCNVGSGGVSSAGGGTGPCFLEPGDGVTGPAGNLMVSGQTIAEGTVFWAWTGQVGGRLDWDGDRSQPLGAGAVSSVASVTVGTIVPARAQVTLNLPEDSEDGHTAHYGTRVTVTVQILDAQNNPTGASGLSYNWSAVGVHESDHSARPADGVGLRQITTDSNGRASFNLPEADPDTNRRIDPGFDADGDDDDKTTWTYTIDPVDDAPDLVSNPDIRFFAHRGSGIVVFDDDPPRTSKLTVELPRQWTRIPASGTVGANLTGRVTDQYGYPMRGRAVFFETAGADAFPSDVTDGAVPGTTSLVTGPDGTASVPVVFEPGLTAGRAVYRAGADLSHDNRISSSEVDSAVHYWVEPPVGFNPTTGTAPRTTGFASLYAVDLAGNAFIRATAAGEPAPRLYRYGETSVFRYFVADDPQDHRWLNKADFESRFAQHAARSGGEPNAELSVTRYEPGLSIFEVRLPKGARLDDPDF